MSRFLIRGLLATGALYFGFAFQAGSNLLGLAAVACVFGAAVIAVTTHWERIEQFAEWSRLREWLGGDR
jgi:hypothetical protein